MPTVQSTTKWWVVAAVCAFIIAGGLLAWLQPRAPDLEHVSAETRSEVAGQCLKCLVSGDVQDVGYRAATRDRALALGVTGYAKNLSDGRVEVMACGDAPAVDTLVGWLAQGPRLATVTDVSTQGVRAKAVGQHTDFEVR